MHTPGFEGDGFKGQTTSRVCLWGLPVDLARHGRDLGGFNDAVCEGERELSEACAPSLPGACELRAAGREAWLASLEEEPVQPRNVLGCSFPEWMAE